MNLYQELLIDHYRYPRNKGTLENPDIASESLNPSCGDQIALQAKLENNRIVKVAFTGHGCVISQAAGSLLTEYILNKTLDDLIKLQKEHITQLIGIELGPTRLRCALLALEALHQAIAQYRINSLI